MFVYYPLEVSLIAFIFTSFERFFNKICYNFSIFPKKKAYYKGKEIDFCYKKIIILNTNFFFFLGKLSIYYLSDNKKSYLIISP